MPAGKFCILKQQRLHARDNHVLGDDGNGAKRMEGGKGVCGAEHN